MGRMYSVLQQYQVEKGSDFTHTSIVKPSGSFYIPGEKLDEFFKIYTAAMKGGCDLYLTEKPRDIIPILIDLDFRFTKDSVDSINRKYTFDDLKNIANLYIKHIKNIIDTPEHFKVYIMEKPAPVINKELIKDGIHIVIPDIITKPSVQLLIRQEVIKEIPSIFNHLGLYNSYHDVVDEAVITTNNWQMYGSKKPNCEAYKITHVFDENMVELDINTDEDYVNMLSLRNKYDESETKFDKLNMVKEIQDAKKKDKMMKNNSIFQTSQNIKKNTCDDLEYIIKLLNILSIQRADNYSLWIRLGWCLRNIDHRLLNGWIEFSKKSTKFTEGECERIWNYMKDDGLGIGSLHMWAREDNPEQYKEIIRTDLNRLLDRAASETHTDIATVVYNMFRYEYVCISIKNNLWFEFKSHRWNICDSAHTLRMHISSTVSQEFSRRSAYWAQKASIESEESEQSRCSEKAKKLITISMNLKKVSFKENILKESRDIFYQTKFEEKLDSRSHLIGFENGVYDLESKEFREGRPEDFIMFTTGINYTPYDPTNQYSLEIDDFLSKVLTNPNMKEYITSLFASFLNGNIRQERFHIWTGSGCFARDTPVMMYDGSSKVVQEVEIGDVLMGDDSTPRNVMELFRGFSDMYKIIPSKGDPFIVNGEHILALKDKDNEIVKMTMHQFLKLTDRSNYKLYRPESVNFKSQKTDNIHFKDDERIPNELKMNNKEVRKSVLEEIMKHVIDNKIHHKSEEFLNDVLWIARSCGMSCYKENNHVIFDGELNYSFVIERVENDNFYGFELDGNHLFLKGNGDFTVLSNSNGKSKIIDLFERCFGEYCCKLPITLLTQKRAAANAATSELARTKGKRFACLQEPSEDEKLNVGLMKELSGGDKIQARLLYKEPIEFKPQFKMILTCNHLPSVPSDDGGTWRRIRVAEFTSRFCESPDPNKPTEFEMDITLSDKFDLWTEQFMALLIDKYINKIADNGVSEPEEVMICTKDYQKTNDIYAEFISTETENHEMEYISYNDLLNSFKSFLKDNNVANNPSVIKKSNFVKNIEKAYGKICIANGVEIWKGCRFKLNRFANQADDLDR